MVPSVARPQLSPGDPKIQIAGSTTHPLSTADISGGSRGGLGSIVHLYVPLILQERSSHRHKSVTMPPIGEKGGFNFPLGLANPAWLDFRGDAYLASQ
jgi:hypothetical protein